MQNTQNNPSLWSLEKELSELNVVLREKIGEFLWQNSDNISQEFIERFNGIREDVLSKLPWVITIYYKEKQIFDQQYADQRISQLTSSKKRKWKLWRFPIFVDPKLPTLLPEQRAKLLEFSNFLSLDLEWKITPEDVLIRAVLMIQKRAIAVLENRDSDVAQLSKEAKREIRDLARITRVYNFAHGVAKRKW